MATSAPGQGWTIEYQTETVDLGPDGRAVQGVKVGFCTGKGVHNSVFVPKARYSLENVRAAVSLAATEIDKVHTLTG